MVRHDRPPSDAGSEDAKTTPAVDDLIRPSLRCAFSMPAEGDLDDKFRLLLEALAQRQR